MSHEIRHLLTFQLADGSIPQLPSYLSGYTQFKPDLNWFSIRGDISGAPTPEILDSLIRQGVRLCSPSWSFELYGDPDRACAFALEVSSSGDRRYVQLLNAPDDLLDPTGPPGSAKLRPERDAFLSKSPQGPFSIVANNLLVSDAALKTLGLFSAGEVHVNNKRVGWHVVRPDTSSVLDASLCFSPVNSRPQHPLHANIPYRSHLANIANPNSPATFGVATDTQRWGHNLSDEIYLIDIESATTIFPGSKRVLGDISLTPVFPHESSEAELLRSVTQRANQLEITNVSR